MALISPANADALAYLSSVGVALMQILTNAGLPPKLQIGEPWWWVQTSGRICLYDAAAIAALGGDPAAIDDVRGPLTEVQRNLLDAAGVMLANATDQILDVVRSAFPDVETYLLVYLPGVLDPKSPELRRANLPSGWTFPAFDFLQTEDYEWVTGRRDGHCQRALREASARLAYPPERQQYLAGFARSTAAREDWASIIGAASRRQREGAGDVFLWALPQILRDGLTLFAGETEVDAFDDILFPIEIGADASVAPGFSTSIVTSAGGFEFRNSNWAQARLRFDAGPGIRGDRELEQLIAFFRARRGPAIGFRFQDEHDFTSNGMTFDPTPTDQLIGTGDGERTRFALVKTYGSGEIRRITRPRRGTVLVAVDGVERVTGWEVQDAGFVSFDEPPSGGAEVTAGFRFDVPVRFTEDRIEINRVSFQAGEAPSVPLIEIREDFE